MIPNLHRIRRPLALCAAIAGVVIFLEQSAADRCRRTADDDVARIARLEDEIAFRREVLSNSLDAARTKADIEAAEPVVEGQKAFHLPEMRGMTLRDVSDAYNQLREAVVVKAGPGAQDAAIMRTGTDDWLLDAFPVDQVGYLYGASPNQLDSLRLAARQLLQEFNRNRLTDATWREKFAPACGIGTVFRYLLSGGSRVVVREAAK